MVDIEAVADDEEVCELCEGYIDDHCYDCGECDCDGFDCQEEEETEDNA